MVTPRADHHPEARRHVRDGGSRPAASGEMETPQDPSKAGWLTPNPPPGLAGTAVVAGHVTWDGVPAVFYRLHELSRGDRVRVRRADGRTAVFTVTRTARFPKTRFPTRAVFGQVSHPALRLITCGGSYDASTGHYVDNVIVWARMVPADAAHVHEADGHR
jgi:sortase (surface protein transpeptidase)